jgi:hypothetical protein
MGFLCCNSRTPSPWPLPCVCRALVLLLKGSRVSRRAEARLCVGEARGDPGGRARRLLRPPTVGKARRREPRRRAGFHRGTTAAATARCYRGRWPIGDEASRGSDSRWRVRLQHQDMKAESFTTHTKGEEPTFVSSHGRVRCRPIARAFDSSILTTPDAGRKLLFYRGARLVRAEIIPVEPAWVVPAKGAIGVPDRVPPTGAISALIFDCDGTLVDTSELKPDPDSFLESARCLSVPVHGLNGQRG